MKMPENWKKIIEQVLIEHKEIGESPCVDYITPAQFSAISFEEYKRQWILQKRLYEITYIPMLPELRCLVDEMIEGGIVLKEEKMRGFIIVPIIGIGYFTIEKWQDLTNRLRKDTNVLSELKEKLKKLAEVQNKVMYSISCENRKSECKIMQDTCYLSNCNIALSAFDLMLSELYKNMKNKALEQTAQNAV